MARLIDTARIGLKVGKDGKPETGEYPATLKTSEVGDVGSKAVCRILDGDIRVFHGNGVDEAKLVITVDFGAPLGIKSLPLNKTNATALLGMFGNDMDQWVKKPIQLVVEKTTYDGNPINGLRVRKA